MQKFLFDSRMIVFGTSCFLTGCLIGWGLHRMFIKASTLIKDPRSIPLQKIPGRKAVTIFCGSREGKSKEYIESAIKIADEMKKRNLDLIYGGGTIGIMGAVAKRVIESRFIFSFLLKIISFNLFF